MDINISVSNQRLRVATNLKDLVSGTQEFIKFCFELGTEWDGLLTFAQFKQSNNAYNQYLDEENCAYLPSEIQPGTCTLTLYGSGGNTIATTNYLTFTIIENSIIIDAQSTDISQTLYTQLVNKVNGINSNMSDYINKTSNLKLLVSNVFAELKDALNNRDTESAVAILDQAILDLDVLDDYEPIRIISFTVNPSLIEIGSSVDTFDISYEFSRIPEVAMLDDENLGNKISDSDTWAHVNPFTSNTSFTITCSAAGHSDSKTVNITFENDVYFGTDSIPAEVNSEFINSLSNKVLGDVKERTINLNCGTDEYIWYAYPERLGTATFTGAVFDSPEIVSVTNNSEYTENYYVYKSTDHTLGEIEIEVS